MGGQPWSTLTHLASKILWPDLTECDIKMSTLSVFYVRLHTALELISQVLACCPGSYLLQVNNILLRSVPVINHCNVLMLFHLVLVINQMSQWILLFILCVSNIFGLRLEACSSILAAHSFAANTFWSDTTKRSCAPVNGVCTVPIHIVADRVFFKYVLFLMSNFVFLDLLENHFWVILYSTLTVFLFYFIHSISSQGKLNTLYKTMNQSVYLSQVIIIIIILHWLDMHDMGRVILPITYIY